jgi:hypothetical protein
LLRGARDRSRNGLRRSRGLSRPRERVNAPERTGRRLDGEDDRLKLRRLGLKLRQRRLDVGERNLRVLWELGAPRAFDLVERPHRFRDWRCELEEASRHLRVALQRVERSRK